MVGSPAIIDELPDFDFFSTTGFEITKPKYLEMPFRASKVFCSLYLIVTSGIASDFLQSYALYTSIDFPKTINFGAAL